MSTQNAQNNNLVGIKNSWSLIAFAKAFGRTMQVGDFSDKETGDTWSSCIFTDEDGHKTFVAFSTNLGVLSEREIERRKDELQVVLTENDKYKLCRAGGNTWRTVNLGL